MIYKHKSTKSNSCKYCHVSLTIQLKHQLFIDTHLNDQTVLLQAIQLSNSHLFALSLNIKQFYRTLSVDLRAMTIKGYSAFPKAPALLEPRYQIV